MRYCCKGLAALVLRITCNYGDPLVHPVVQAPRRAVWTSKEKVSWLSVIIQKVFCPGL